jgi:hypothetical protein
MGDWTRQHETCDCCRVIGQPFQCPECYERLVPGQPHRVPEDCEAWRRHFETVFADPFAGDVDA